MAIVKIEKATVTRVNSKGFGVQVTEPSRESNGKTFKGDRYTLWFKDAHGLTEGDVVSVSGFLGAKVGEPWKGTDDVERRSVELSVNSPKLDGFPEPAPVEEPWATGNDSQEVPF